MSGLTKHSQPYELLVRWDDHGQLAGAHYQVRTVYRDGDVIVADRIDDPVPVTVGGNDGFPLDAILTPAHLDAVAPVNRAVAARDAALAEVARLSAELDRLSPQRPSFSQTGFESPGEMQENWRPR